MNKKSLPARIPVGIGALLLLFAIALIVRTFIGNQSSITNVTEVTEKIEEMIPPRTPGIIEQRYNAEMPMMNVYGNDYIGIVELPDRKIKLPVYSLWSENIVKTVPCRYSGSVYNGTLVIGGENTNGNFEFLTEIDSGDLITFTDMTGQEFSYEVSSITHSSKPDFTLNESSFILFSYIDNISKYILVSCK